MISEGSAAPIRSFCQILRTGSAGLEKMGVKDQISLHQRTMFSDLYSAFLDFLGTDCRLSESVASVAVPSAKDVAKSLEF